MLQRVSIQNFKSLKDVTLDLQKVNLLIGPNNSGKTNFLKAITSFGKDTGIGEMSYKKLPGVISFSINYQFDKNSVFYETLPFPNLEYTRSIDISINGNSRLTNYTLPKKLFFYDSRDKKLVFNEDTPFLEDVYQYLNVPIYKLNPDSIISSSQYKSDSNLKEDGSNILEFLQYLYSRLPFSFEELVLDFAKITTDFVRIRMPDTQPGMFQLQLFDINGVGYLKDELSEGILYFLSLLCIFYQPNPPKLLLLEEPERGIHPRRIGEVMNFIFRLAEEKNVQIILTTHNEHVLNDFSTRPECVFVFDKNEEGATEVRNLKKDIIDPSHKRSRELGLDGVDFTTNLSDNWIYGLLGGVPENI